MGTRIQFSCLLSQRAFLSVNSTREGLQLLYTTEESNEFHEAAISEKELNAFRCIPLKLILKEYFGGETSFYKCKYSIPIIGI